MNCLKVCLTSSVKQIYGVRKALKSPQAALLNHQEILRQMGDVDNPLGVVCIDHCGPGSIVSPNQSESAATFLPVSVTAICTLLNPIYQSSGFGFWVSDL